MRDFFTTRWVEMLVCAVLIGAGLVIVRESVLLGAGWSERGPEPGFFPMVLAVTLCIGAFLTLFSAWLGSNRQPFFSASEEWVDLLKVGAPSAAAIVATPTLGLYLTSAVYVWVFMSWYGHYRWYTGLITGVVVSAVLYVGLRHAFNIGMPMSPWYRQGILPI